METNKEKEIAKLRDRQEWQGEYKGVNFDIVKWKPDYSKPEYDEGYKWNYYIYVNPRKLRTSKGFRKDTRNVNYWKMYPDVEMHGDVTYWARVKGSTLREVDKLGCDYCHIWDYEGDGFYDSCKLKEYSKEDIMRDIEKTIDKLPKDLFFKRN